jgi:diguanylate cyclase (GGDEF)-like protein
VRNVGWLTGVSSAIAIGFAAWLIGGWGGKSTVEAVDDLGLVGFALFAAVCSGFAAWKSSGRQRVAWICFSIGAGGWVVGSALWAYYELWADVAPFPSLADAGYLILPVAVCVGLVFFPVGYTGQSQTRLVLDGLIFAGALFEVAWVLVLRTIYESGGASRFAGGLSLAYPVADLVIITVAVMVLARARTGQRTTLTLLTAGIVLIALSDSGFAYLTAHNAYKTASLIDLGWAAGLLLIGVAALISAAAPAAAASTSQVPTWVSMWLPYMPTLLATVVCVPAFISVPGLGPIIFTAFVLVTMVLVRQFIVFAENRRLLATVADQAFRDPLTGLANRALFNDRLTHAVQLHQRDQQSVAVLSLDLDDFKLVNDSMGHPAGDALLVLIAERLMGCVRTSDTIARLGGDEFAVLMEGKPEHARLIAHRVVQAFDDPFDIDGHDLLIRPSVGLAVAAADEPEISADELLKQADIAMYSAKRSRTGGVHTFTPEMHLIEPKELESSESGNGGVGSGAATVRLLGELRRAIDHVDLSLVYQPKFDLRDNDIVGVEALVRWPHRDRGLLGPDHFLPLVREHGLMRSVTELVLAQALDDVAGWHAHGFTVPVAVNIFAPSLGDLELPRQIARALSDRNLRPDALTVEITEDLLLDNLARTRTVLDRLRENGVRIAIDDFGSGYSALWYLRDLPVDEVKLDRQFIAPVLVDPRAAAIVRAVIDLAHVLGVTTVAEGVEDALTAIRLLEYGCEVAQGYYYSPPVAAQAMLEMLSSRHQDDPRAASTAVPST